jgi:hypothetical protein
VERDFPRLMLKMSNKVPQVQWLMSSHATCALSVRLRVPQPTNAVEASDRIAEPFPPSGESSPSARAVYHLGFDKKGIMSAPR